MTSSEKRIAHLKAVSQECVQTFASSLHSMVSSIWWRSDVPMVVQFKVGTAIEFDPVWEALNPTFVLTQLFAETHREGATAASVEEASKYSRAQVMLKWRDLMDLFTLSPRPLLEGQLPVVWMSSTFVELTQLYVDSVTEFHQFIFGSMVEDLDQESADNFLSDLMKLNAWFGHFKRVWRDQSEIVNKDLAEVKELLRPEVKAVLRARLG